MKRIPISAYRYSMGKLIDVSDPEVYIESHHPDAVNIPLDKLLLHYKEYLVPNVPYFIMCKKGHLSKKAVQILTYYGFDITQVYNE